MLAKKSLSIMASTILVSIITLTCTTPCFASDEVLDSEIVEEAEDTIEAQLEAQQSPYSENLHVSVQIPEVEEEDVQEDIPVENVEAEPQPTIEPGEPEEVPEQPDSEKPELPENTPEGENLHVSRPTEESKEEEKEDIPEINVDVEREPEGVKAAKRDTPKEPTTTTQPISKAPTNVIKVTGDNTSAVIILALATIASIIGIAIGKIEDRFF